MPAGKKAYCLNCKADLKSVKKELDTYCPECGQKNTDRRIGFFYLIQEFLGDYFTFDSKLFRSLIPLVFQPGKLTEDFLDGKRIRHIPPLRMYIFTSVIYFALINFMVFNWLNAMPGVKEALNQSVINSSTSNTPKVTMNVDSVPKAVLDSVELINESNISDPEPANAPEYVVLQGDTIMRSDTINSYINNADAEKVIKDFGIENTWLKRFVRQSEKLVNTSSAQFIQSMISNASIILFFMLPFFALIMQIFYWKHYYIEHLIHGIHLHTFILIFSLLIVTFAIFGVSSAFGYLVPFLFLYQVFSFKQVYKQGYFITIIKAGFINFLYMIVITLAMFVLIFMVFYQL